MNTQSDKLWIEACEVLSWHRMNADSCIQTLNRLWHKSPWVVGLESLPLLVEGQMQLSEEQWSLERLEALLHERQRTPNVPKSVTAATIVVRSDGTDYLIDGRTRINYWLRRGTEGPYRALVIKNAQLDGV